MRKIINLIKQVFSEWSEDKASKHAAALAYYAVFSLAPLLVIVIALVGLFGGAQAAQGLVMTQIQNLIGSEGAKFVRDMVASASRPATGIVATIVGLVTLALGALGAFGELQDALNTIWEVKLKPTHGVMGAVKTLLVDRLLSFAMILVIGFLLLVTLVVSAALSAFTQYVGGVIPFSAILLSIIQAVVALGLITLLFALMFKFLPDAKIAWRDVWLGAFVTAILFTIGKFAIGLYLGRSRVNTTFGAAGSLAILLIWIYYSAQIVFLGAEFTQVYANLYGSKIWPNEKAEPLTEEKRAQAGIPHRGTAGERARGHAPVPAGAAGGVALPAKQHAPARVLSTATLEYRGRPRSPYLLPTSQRRRSRRAGQIVSVALLGGVLALVGSFAQIIKDVRKS